jgi:hypothetical protein
MTDLTMDPNLPPAPVEIAGGGPAPSWQEQDITLRDMWTQNKSQQEIADALGRSIPAIMTRAARLGLPRRSAPGRKPGQRSVNHQGAAAAYATTRRAAPRAAMGSSAEAQPQTSPRVCLMCLKKFESFGRHNRICTSCKGSAEYETASALPNIHIPSS